MEPKDEELEKAWPKEYSRVKGQDKNKGTSSKAQYRFMQAAASGSAGDISPGEAKEYLANSPKGGEGLPEKGSGGARGEREKKRHEKKKESKKDSDKAKKTDEDDMEKGALKNLAAGAAIAGTLLTAKPAQAEMQHQHQLSHEFAKYLVDQEGGTETLSAFHEGNMVPVVWGDKDTGHMKLMLHDGNNKKSIVGHIGDENDQSMHFPTQKMSGERWHAIKDHSNNLQQHFHGFIKSKLQQMKQVNQAAEPKASSTPTVKPEAASKAENDLVSYIKRGTNEMKSKPEVPKGDSEAESTKRIKEANRPKVVSFDEQVKRIKEKYKEKKPKTFNEEVESVKQRYNTPIAKSRDIFYANIEGCLSKGANEELISQLMDMDAYLFVDDNAALDSLYKSTDRYFNAILSPEERVVYELSYMAKDGCDVSYDSLVKFLCEMHDEFIKSITIEDVIRDGIRISLEKRENSGGFKDQIKGGLADKKKPCDFDQKQLEAGIKIEMEHTDDKQVATEIAMDHLTEDPDYYKKLKVMEDGGCDKKEASEDNSRVVGKKNGESVRMVHGYARYTSGPKRGEYVHRHEAEKRLGRRLSSDEHVHHKDGNRAGTKNTKVSSRSEHTAETNKKRANSKNGYSGDHRVEHTGSH